MPTSLQSRNNADHSAPVKPRSGLLYWAECAIDDLHRVRSRFDADPVHDLRVAIRRCRSMAQGLRGIDPTPGWKQFRGLAKPLFSSLGELRDTQVLEGWLSSLAPQTDPLRAVLSAEFAHREAERKRDARRVINSFNAKRWWKLSKELDQRARRLTTGSKVFQLLALERWMEAHQLHETAMRTHRDADLHQLRIAIKRFRYTVENFLPEHHRRWSQDLKYVQDLLGEVHDLDLLLAEVTQTDPAAAAASELTARIHSERMKRVSEYEHKMTGSLEMWGAWRDGLPIGRELSLTVTAKLRHWSRTLAPDPAHSQRVAKASIKLWRELRRELGWPFDGRATVLLRAAAFLHDVGEDKGKKRRQSYRAKIVGKLSVPVGWSEAEMRIVQLVSRYCSGPMPSSADVEFAALPWPVQRHIARLAGVLRLADALETGETTFRNLRARKVNGVVLLFVDEFDVLSNHALEVAAARQLFEASEDVAILLRKAPTVSENVLGAVAAAG